VEKCKKDQFDPKYSLPESERIYFKDFHFLDEPLAEKQKKKEEVKKAKRLESEEAKQVEIPSFSN
jgi:hypothetical protein